MPRKRKDSWKSIGCGQYRRKADESWQVRWQPLGAKGPRYNRIIEGNEAEIIGLLTNQKVNRNRRQYGLEMQTSWKMAIETYETHLESKGVTGPYKKEVIEILTDLKDHTGLELVSDVEPLHVQMWLNDVSILLQKAGRKGWARTTNKKRSMAGAFFRWLYRMRYISQQPVDATQPFKETKKPPRDLKPDEYAKVWNVCEPSIQDFLDWLLLTGCRISEAINLKHSDIKEGQWILKNRKGKDFLRMQLPTELLELVARQKAKSDGLVFHRWVPRKPSTQKGHGFKEGAKVSREWFDALIKERCKIAEVENFSAHDLRHAAASWASSEGVSPWFVQSLLGHSTIKMTERYRHASLKTEQNQAIQALLRVRVNAIQKQHEA